MLCSRRIRTPDIMTPWPSIKPRTAQGRRAIDLSFSLSAWCARTFRLWRPRVALNLMMPVEWLIRISRRTTTSTCLPARRTHDGSQEIRRARSAAATMGPSPTWMNNSVVSWPARPSRASRQHHRRLRIRPRLLARRTSDVKKESSGTRPFKCPHHFGARQKARRAHPSHRRTRRPIPYPCRTHGLASRTQGARASLVPLLNNPVAQLDRQDA